MKTALTPEKKPKRAQLPRGVRVFPNRQRGNWTVQITNDGVSKSSSWPTREAAMEYAKTCKVAKREHGNAALATLTAEEVKDWILVREALAGASVSKLLAVWERHKGDVGVFSARPLREAVDQYLDERKGRTRSRDDHNHAKLYLGRMCDFLGEKDIAEVKKADVRDWLKSLDFKGWSLVSHFKSARAFFGRAVRDEWIRDNPMVGLDVPQVKSDDVSVISVKDAASLFAANREHPIVVRLALEAFGGLRASSCRRLKFEDIRWEDHGIILPGNAHKSGKRHYMEGQPENLWSWLKPWRNVPAAWDWKGSQLMHEKSKAYVRARLKLPNNVLRHSFASYHIAMHTDAAKTAILMQHTNQVMLYKHYKGVASKADAEKYFAIVP